MERLKPIMSKDAHATSMIDDFVHPQTIPSQNVWAISVPKPRQGRKRIARRGIAATKLSGSESTPSPACARPPPPAGDRYAEIHFTRFAFLCPPLAGARNGEAVRLLTPEGVPGVDIRFRVHDILSLIGLISAREKCQSRTVKGRNA